MERQNHGSAMSGMTACRVPSSEHRGLTAPLSMMAARNRGFPFDPLLSPSYARRWKAVEMAPGKQRRSAIDLGDLHIDLTCAFTKDSDLVRVSTEGRDVVGYPLHTQSLVEQASID